MIKKTLWFILFFSIPSADAAKILFFGDSHSVATYGPFGIKMNPFLLLIFLLSITVHADTNIDRLKEIVNINSGSANIKGVTAVQEKIKPWFEELGFKVELKKNPAGEKISAPILIATLLGEKPGTITFIMHADTVFEPNSAFQKWDMKDEYLMHGPGVIDDKGGIIVALQAVKDYLSLSPKKTPKHSLRVVITPNEEVGAIGFHEIFQEMSKNSFMALGMEPSLKEGIVEARKGNVWYEISVTGKEAHAGVDHASGINACDILSEKITQLKKLTDYKKNVTVSVGHIEGGQDKYNIVCGWAKAKVDTRIPSPEVRKTLNAKIETILKNPQITFKIVDETAPMSSNAISKPLIKKYLDLIEKTEGKRPLSYVSGGVGDANHFAREGIAVMDGLGPIGAEMHTASEWIDLRSISSRAKILTLFLSTL